MTEEQHTPAPVNEAESIAENSERTQTVGVAGHSGHWLLNSKSAIAHEGPQAVRDLQSMSAYRNVRPTEQDAASKLLQYEYERLTDDAKDTTRVIYRAEQSLERARAYRQHCLDGAAAVERLQQLHLADMQQAAHPASGHSCSYKITDHVFTAGSGQNSEDACTFRHDGTDLTSCGEAKADHE